MYDAIVTIRFDDEEATEFAVHRGLICYHSGFFRGALQGHFLESGEKVVTLPAFEAPAFRTFMRWMYTSRLCDPGVSFNIEVAKEVREMIDAYILADKRGIPGLKNAIIDLLIEANVECNHIPTLSVVQAWSSLPESDGLRNLFLDWLSMQKLGTGFFDDQHLDRYPPRFMLKLLQRITRPDRSPAMREDKQWLASKCLYHDHRGAEVGGSQALRS